MDSLKKKLGKRIQQFRKAQKLTQERLSEIIDLDTPNLSNIECGRRFMTAETLEKIAKALNVKESDLFNFSDDNNLIKNDISLKLDILNDKELKIVQDLINGLIELR